MNQLMRRCCQPSDSHSQ